MPTGPSPAGPRHLAGRTARAVTAPAPRRVVPPAHRIGVASSRPPFPPADDAIDLEAPVPVARVKRSRLAFATAVTLAAVPILVVDNLPATADTGKAAVIVEAAPSTEITTTSTAPTTTEATTTTTVPAPTTTAAPAPTTTLAPPPPKPTPAAPTTTTTTAPPPVYTPPPPTTSAYGDPADPATWDRLAQCESGGDWALNTGNGYYGGLQFSLGTWQDVGGTGYPHEASREEQIRRGQILQGRYGWGQWPYCSAKLGYH